MSAEPDYIWNADDWEFTLNAADQDILTDDMRCGDVMRVGRAVKLPDVWIVKDREGEFHQFASADDAKSFLAEMETRDV